MELPAAKRVDFSTGITVGNSIRIIYFPNVTFFKNSYRTHYSGLVSDSEFVEYIYLPNLVQSEGPDGGYGNGLFINLPNCKIIRAPKLTTHTKSDSRQCAIGKLNNLVELDFSSYDGSFWDGSQTYPSFTECYKLLKFMVKVRRQNTLSVKYWYPSLAFNVYDDLVTDSFCNNNYEQFLYNFRTYIIDRLYDYTGSTKRYVYLHATTKSVVFGEDESGYANTYYMPGEQIDYVTSLNQKLTDINWGVGV